jgi:hypothetical protein
MTTSTAAAAIGMKIARKFFAKRGNHSEVHLSELELASLLTVAADVGAGDLLSILEHTLVTLRGMTSKEFQAGADEDIRARISDALAHHRGD